jgi:hypothetical protein
VCEFGLVSFLKRAFVVGAPPTSNQRISINEESSVPMKSRAFSVATLPSFAEDEEVTSVRRIPALPIEIGCEIFETSVDRDASDPTPVYAHPYTLIGIEKTMANRAYFLGTRFILGLVPSVSWEEEMRADGVSGVIIEKCRRYVDSNAM